MDTMIAARLHAFDRPMVLETLPIPEPRSSEVLVKVMACGMVPNLRNVLAFFAKTLPYLPLPRLPAIFGLDVAGVVSKVGESEHNFKPGDRVYVSPGLTCGSCPSCAADDSINCHNFTFRGYFGFGPDSQKLYDQYPYGGMSEYITAPQRNLVRIPDNLEFAAAARFGYLGTAYASLEKAEAGPGKTILINGITGTLGLCACLIALGMGVTRILGTARNKELMDRVRALAPGRIECLALGGDKINDWARGLTGGYGVDGVVDCLGPGAAGELMIEAIYALRRGGAYVNVNGVDDPVALDVKWMQAHQIACLGNNWFSIGQGQAMADMVRFGTLDLSMLEHRKFPLSGVNDAIDNLPARNGGFSNFVIVP